jgi:hypothetical protein
VTLSFKKNRQIIGVMENNNIKNQNQNHQEPIWLMMVAGILGAL